MKGNFDTVRFSNMAKAFEDSCGRAVETAAKRSGITKTEAYLLIFFFNRAESDFIPEADEICGYTRNFALENLRKLESRGLAEIIETPDGSVSGVTVTGRGGIIAKALNSALEKHFERLTAGITAEEETVLKRVTEKIYENSLKL